MLNNQRAKHGDTIERSLFLPLYIMNMNIYIYIYICIHIYIYVYILIHVDAAGLSGFAPTFRRIQVGQGPFRSPISLLKTPRNWMILGGPGLRNPQRRCGLHFFQINVYIYICIFFRDTHTHMHTWRYVTFKAKSGRPDASPPMVV